VRIAKGCYISTVLGLMRQHPRFFLAITLAGLALRLFFFFQYSAITDDSRVYADFATNWMQHGIYGRTVNEQIVPADSRLPGYPMFLAAVFAVFGIGNFRAVLLVQIVLDLIGCFVIADLARRMICERAARVAFALAALCPFLANYSAAALTETLEILFTTLALDCAVAGLNAFDLLMPWHRKIVPWMGSGLGLGACILLRPDGGILLASVGFYLLIVLVKRSRHKQSLKPVIEAGVIASFTAVIFLVPWAIRNFRTFHHFQPLAPRYATEQDELPPRGFNRWVRAWIVDYTSVEEIYWSVPGNPIDASKLPERAFDSPEQRQETLALNKDYNDSGDLTPELDARFNYVAAERIANHKFRYYLGLPLLRIADMWLRPRTELLPPDPRWWEFNDLLSSSVMSVTFGVLNLAYIGAACWAVLSRRRVRWLGLLLLFVVLRSAFLGSLENPEARYTLEGYPVLITLAAAFVGGTRIQPGRQVSN
jgi:4-amino-4-deoxy-L-arabinose transferase-like glycosyltransferase